MSGHSDSENEVNEEEECYYYARLESIAEAKCLVRYHKDMVRYI